MTERTLEDRDALVAHYRASRQAFLEAIDGLPDNRLTERSLDGWSVKDHMAHLSFWDDVRADEIERMSLGFESVWKLEEGQDQAINEIVTPARWELSLAQVRWEFERSREQVIDALQRAAPEALDPSRYGEAGLVSQHELQHAGWIREWRVASGL